MHARSTWPRGLRIIYWFSVAGFTVGVMQMVYWHFSTQEFFPHLTFQGGYALIAFVLGLVCVLAGTMGRRRAFAILSLVATAFHLCALIYFTFQGWTSMLPEVAAGRASLVQEWQANAVPNAWNSFAVAGYLIVCYYLLPYEFKVFGRLTMNHNR